MRDNYFSIRMTKFMKGIAIIIMIIHHSIRNNPGLPVALTWGNLGLLIGTSSKVCVCLFTVLSGYGITISWEKSKNHGTFIKNHIVKLWLSFMPMYLFCLGWKAIQGTDTVGIYGKSLKGVFFFLKDITGLQNFVVETPTLVGAWWYMEAIYICYVLFPLFYRIIRRSVFSTIILLFVLYIPWLLYQFCHGWEWHTDRELFYLFSFVLGMVCANWRAFDKVIAIASAKRAICVFSSLAVALAMFLLRSNC